MSPLKIQVKDKKYLYIQWDDNSESRILLSVLRKNCPCANCIADRHNYTEGYIPLLSEAHLTLVKIEPIGSYAIRLYWKDGHDTGIYDYEFLKELRAEGK
jgi:DUF971 family protein